MVREGHRAVMVYLIQRGDAKRFTLSGDIDPDYAESFALAHDAGVEAIAYRCALNETGIELDRSVRIAI